MLTLRKYGFMIRWFEMSLRIWDAFIETHSNYWFSDRTDICHFTRTIFVAAPITIVLNVAVFMAAIWVFVYWPLMIIGPQVYSIAIMVFGALFVGYLMTWSVSEATKVVLNLEYPDWVEDPPWVNSVREFFQIMWAFMVAAKKRICPLIEVSS